MKLRSYHVAPSVAGALVLRSASVGSMTLPFSSPAATFDSGKTLFDNLEDIYLLDIIDDISFEFATVGYLRNCFATTPEVRKAAKMLILGFWLGIWDT